MAADWTTLAIALEFEDLQLTTHHQADSAATEVLQELVVEGEGMQPVNWSTLIATLEESKLAEDIKEAVLEL